jgi:hypothetical protein
MAASAALPSHSPKPCTGYEAARASVLASNKSLNDALPENAESLLRAFSALANSRSSSVGPSHPG